MAREMKQLIVKELTARYQGIDRCVVVDLTGLKATTLGQIRGDLKKQGIGLAVVKNSLAVKALSEMGLGELGLLLKGPSALAIGEKDALALVKAVVLCAAKNKIKVRGALADGKIFQQAEVTKLAKTPEKKVLQAMFMSVMQAPTTKLVGFMDALAKKLAPPAPPAEPVAENPVQA